MEMFWVVIILALLGVSLGSFANAAVWRLHEKKDMVSDRSECPKCHHKLAWYDLLPIVSWLWLRGACRYCHKAISWQYPIVELSVGVLFVVSYLVWPSALVMPLEIALFALWLVAVVMMTILFVYDLRWLLLPNKIVFPLIAVGVVMAGIRLIEAPDILSSGLNLLYSSIVLAGLYLVLYIASRGQWVGFGDVKLCLFLGLLLGEWQLALIALFLANFIGCLVVLPGMVMGKVTRTSRVPFGPLLVVGSVIALLAGPYFINWYMSTLLVGF